MITIINCTEVPAPVNAGGDIILSLCLLLLFAVISFFALMLFLLYLVKKLHRML